MNLKKLEILGFKSFANKTVIDFSRGMTAIVGPNGCGKTNILDALRWVLGEQKVSMLRGSKMEEIIFNGTRDMKPLGMSEVTLTLDNDKGVLPTEYSTVQITRRLFRSGESEYLINKVPCRLKDINDLFFDTGMGAHSYSVIQQDMIEAVISDKAEERRFLFEEAAGITKYKQRKKAALRKLDATENDFLRLNDIYSEVQTQVRSLKRQQKKAERHVAITDQIKNWELYLSSTRMQEIEKERRTIKAEHDQMTDKISASETAINKLSSELEVERKEQIDLEQMITKIGNDMYEATEEAHTLETDITILREKKTNAQELINRNDNDIEAHNIRLQMLSEQQEENVQNLKEHQELNETLTSKLENARTEQAEADTLLLSARTSKEDHNQRMIELEGKLSSGKTEETSLKSQETDLTEEVTKYSAELETDSISKEQLLVDRNSKRAKKDEIHQQKESTETELTQKTALVEELIETNELLTSEIANINASVEASQARKSLLEEMILHYEGYESGVKSVMEFKNRWPGIYGTVAEKFVPSDGMEAAVEAALSEMAKFIICDNRDSAKAIIKYLKDEEKGKIGILVPDSGTLNPVIKRPDLQLEEFVGWMDSFVNTDEHLTPLMQAVLSRTAVFKSGHSPDAILERLPYGFTAVSTTGELFSKNIISGGSTDEAFPLFRRQEKVDEQNTLIENFNKEIESKTAEKNKVNADIASTRADLGTLSDKIETLTDELNQAQDEFNEVEYQLRTVDSEIIRLEKTVTNLNEKLGAIKHRQYSLSLDFDQLSDQKVTLVSSISLSSEQLAELESKASNALTTVSESQIKLVECRSLIDQTDSKNKHIGELVVELQNSVERKTEEITQAKDIINSSKDKSASLEESLRVKFNQRQELTKEQSELRERQGSILDRVNDKEKELRETRIEKETINNSSHQIDIRLNTLESESSQISERITEEYSTEIRTVEVANPDDTMSSADSTKLLHDLKEQIRKFGAVNLLALEEYKAANEREEFLCEQLGDLATAKKDLNDTISKINQTAKELFEATFAQVKINFKNLFTELFTGGEADIFLTDPSDPLESDIEIIARPRGKKLISITMMSGGERALTAISLLFSLYMVKPSPFCILDEIDAPLDDANCRRFLRIIDTFSNQTQFILITHNKITMEASHNLYGVTMEQFGVTKLVGVKFSEFEPDNVSESTLIIEKEELEKEELDMLNEFVPKPEENNGHKPTEVSEETDEEADEIPKSVDDLPEKIVERMNETVTAPTENIESNEE